jgi:hypothetical protein
MAFAHTAPVVNADCTRAEVIIFDGRYGDAHADPLSQRWVLTIRNFRRHLSGAWLDCTSLPAPFRRQREHARRVLRNALSR